MRKLTKVTEATLIKLGRRCRKQEIITYSLFIVADTYKATNKRNYTKSFFGVLRESPSVNKLRPWIHSPQE